MYVVVTHYFNIPVEISEVINNKKIILSIIIKPILKESFLVTYLRYSVVK